MSDTLQFDKRTICAAATASGRGAVGIVRVSGPLASSIAKSLTGFDPQPRYAHYGAFYDHAGETIDQGISIFFPGPHSFTGEDIVEFQSHGGPVVIDALLLEITGQGAILARPGEFSERAFLNGKMDLAQAEAVADLIDSTSTVAAKSALRSLQGEFSRLVDQLIDAITRLRIYVEAAIDFPEEEVDFLDSGNVRAKLALIQQQLDDVFMQARQGSILKEGLTVVIAGEPNAGKSSLLNRLAGQERAIVTDIAGTTRDILREHISIDGMPLHIIDTAGLRESMDPVEQEGIRRAWQAIEDADLILLVVDASQGQRYQDSRLWQTLISKLPDQHKISIIENKLDLMPDHSASISEDTAGIIHIRLSARSGAGLPFLTRHLKQQAGYDSNNEGGFMARRRHLDALQRAGKCLEAAMQQLTENRAGELVAEDLRDAQQALGEITGAFTPDDLLGKIFSSFCIGK
jgi:tRNA modification GTPase